MPAFDDLKIFTGNAHPTLAKDICAYLGISLGNCEVFKFKNDNTFVRFQENIRERDVFLVQSISAPVNENIMELLIMIDAAKRASAGAHHGCGSVFRVRAQRQERPAPCADYRPSGCQPFGSRGYKPGA